MKNNNSLGFINLINRIKTPCKIKTYILVFNLLFLFVVTYSQENTMSVIVANKTVDFELKGDGSAKNWKKIDWVKINQRVHIDVAMETKVKVLYSDTGIYFLFFNEDPKLDASFKEDGLHLWTEDVVEVFIWPETSKEIYFEYQLSPLNYELPLMVMNFNGKPHRWQAWYYEDNREIKHKTAVQGANKENGAAIESWTAEFFIPYALLSPIIKEIPTTGTKWRINFNRMDYLNNKEIYWSWQDLPGTFHDIHRFGTMIFN